MKRIKFSVLLAVLSLFISGCYDADKMVIHYDVKKDLSGEAIFTVSGVKATATTVEEQKKDIKELIADFKSPNFMTENPNFPVKGLKNRKVEILNRTELYADFQFTGKFDNFLESLPFTDEEAFEPKIEKEGTKLKISLLLDTEKKENEEAILSIKYEGKFIENNAHTFDKEENILQWNITKLNDNNESVYFVIETDGTVQIRIQLPEKTDYTFFS